MRHADDHGTENVAGAASERACALWSVPVEEPWLRVPVARAATDQLLLAACGIPACGGGDVFRRADLASGVTPRPRRPQASREHPARYTLVKRAPGARRAPGRTAPGYGPRLATTPGFGPASPV